jgi:hypothetical protein
MRSAHISISPRNPFQLNRSRLFTPRSRLFGHIAFSPHRDEERIEETDWDTFLSIIKKERLAAYGTVEIRLKK